MFWLFQETAVQMATLSPPSGTKAVQSVGMRSVLAPVVDMIQVRRA